jgi:hypothetical protein
MWRPGGAWRPLAVLAAGSVLLWALGVLAGSWTNDGGAAGGTFRPSPSDETARQPSVTPAGAITTPGATAAASVSPCTPTDQDAYVYNPDRLTVATPCVRVTGTITTVRTEADGDLHILLALDAAYAGMLTAANQGEELGDLVVEPVCVRAVTQADAVATCAADPDPLTDLPVAGLRVWMEGRYVFDTEHGGWAELHPLYRWGLAGTAPAATITPIASIAGQLGVRVTALTSPVAPGATATLTAHTAGGASCTIVVEYRSGPSSASGLGPATADAGGDVSWTWRVGSRTTAGTWPITVTCAAGGLRGTARTAITVT